MVREIIDVELYPHRHVPLVYTNDQIDDPVAHVLSASPFMKGMNVERIIAALSKVIHRALLNDGTGIEEAVNYADELVMADPYRNNDKSFSVRIASKDTIDSHSMANLSSLELCRIQNDLRAASQAGFNVGIVCGFTDGEDQHILSISICASKLGLPKESQEAWGITPTDYIVVLVKYERRYFSMEEALATWPENYLGIHFRLRKCTKNIPSVEDAVAAFCPNRTEDNIELPHAPELSRLWISKSIDEFMNADFFGMLKQRIGNGLSWDSARTMFHSINAAPNSEDRISREEMAKAERTAGHSLNKTRIPPFLVADHLSDKGEKSLPLVAAQFALYYLISSPEYCAVCHRKVESSTGALRPYVCSSALCLHQFIDLGLGPSIEYEIVQQPKVVDLLISFCYAALVSPLIPAFYGNSRKIRGVREFPMGLNLQTPQVRIGPAFIPYYEKVSKPGKSDSKPGKSDSRLVLFRGATLINPLDVSFSWNSSTATINLGSEGQRPKKGQWVMIVAKTMDESWGGASTVFHHARVVFKKGMVLHLDLQSRHLMPTTTARHGLIDGQTLKEITPDPVPALLVRCEQDFNNLNRYNKAFSLACLLGSLPPVEEMKAYLMENKLQSLSEWDRISKSGLDLLRWIIASNRSYIVEVDNGKPGTETSRPHEKISGVDGWAQFRFAQGSPAKEVLFNEALEGITEQPKTLLGWHGSPLDNWHNIIRQGLDYEEVANGRTYGDGIYLSRDFDVSLKYTQRSAIMESMIWPQSSLKAITAMSLNELVNLPDKLQSKDPFFVVQHCHWTQCRYLFVQLLPDRNQTNPQTESQAEPQTEQNEVIHANNGQVAEFVQHPSYIATGPLVEGVPSTLFIPKNAIPSAQDDPAGPLDHELNKQTIDRGDESNKYIDISKSDFRPGSLDLSTLPQFAPPSYATSAAQRALGQEIAKLQQAQSKTPLHQLGWYIDFEKIDNMFQWIVEFHSFDPELPLAKDMKDYGLTSIVLEIRFPRRFPEAPPFVRVITPRFLPFIRGGGGHVTAGGAICMELLTSTGWSAGNSMEGVLLQVRLAMCSVDPNPARLEGKGSGFYYTGRTRYDLGEAMEAYERAARAHGWEIPSDFREVGSMSLRV
ncbi:uncharacterized protein GGS25DRAFT_181949 [Hypoxylon fragiforme]|uniref:uncharacterized protein n=1 Tax=Hypoxylon fragiforme TaxID=63214 RepID=UPI0020C5F8A8|nr:uncharacterized protein GGS25DRAFT_181949 [Hypoxylon fragiforme]KAI2611103.1 hypothetical protein GGS25DRAFT_181949 [Hypoxylon fragiforme]